MTGNDPNILKSEEVQEILEQMPHRIIRWGMSAIFFILLGLLGLSWLIRYPDVISSHILITTNNPPQKLISQTSGRIEELLVKDGEMVQMGAPLAIVENSANFSDVFILKSITDTISIDRSQFPFDKFRSANFGDIEEAYHLFQKECQAKHLNTELKPFSVELSSNDYERGQLRERLELLRSQIKISESENVIEKNELERHENLYRKGVISLQEIEKQRLLFFQSQRAYKNLLNSYSELLSSENIISSNSKKTKIEEQSSAINLDMSETQAFYRLQKAIKDWELKYVFRSSIGGKITFLNIWSKNQTINLGEHLFAVIPTAENGLVGKAKVSMQNSGKIKVGQKVNIRLDSYPDSEFGVVEGKIKNISQIPNKEDQLLINVIFPKQLHTTYQKEIAFHQEMSGSADIITDDLRLIDRFLFKIKKVVYNN